MWARDNRCESGGVGEGALGWDQVWVPGLSSSVTLGKPLASFASSFLFSETEGSRLYFPGLSQSYCENPKEGVNML